jgi:hypothetical protein
MIESLHEISNGNRVRVLNFATSKNLFAKTTMFPHCNIHNYTCTSSYRETYNHIDHMPIERRHSSILDFRSFRATDCDTDHYPVVAKVRERLAVNKQGPHRFHVEKFTLKKLNEVEVKEKYRVEVSNRFATSENLDAEVEVNTAWETVWENINISAKKSLGYYELKKHKPWFDDRY